MQTDNVTSLIKTKSQSFARRFRRNPLMKLINSDAMKDPKKRMALLDAIQVFSDYFQKSVLLRSALCEDGKFTALVHEHMVEEFDHNEALRADRNHRPTPWDPILEATAAWFNWKMITLDNIEKHVVMHLVLESSANSFFQRAHRVMKQYKETDYFDIHAEADEKHEEMGYAFLNEIHPSQVKRILMILSNAWDMIETTCSQIATLISAQQRKPQSAKN